MKNIEFLKKYQQLQYGIMFDDLVDLRSAILGISNIDLTPFWNLSLVYENISQDELLKIERKMESLERRPVIYIENNTVFSETIDLLKDNHYEKIFEDAWMFWTGNVISKERFSQVRKVSIASELEIYLKTFDACFQDNDPQNPYGELGDYLKVAEQAWHDHHASDRLEYFIVYKDSDPVAVATLTNFEGIGYISNVGSLKEVRGDGFGKLATLYCTEQSKSRGNTTHCLATEENTYPNEFYKRIGFETRFSAIGYAKK